MRKVATVFGVGIFACSLLVSLAFLEWLKEDPLPFHVFFMVTWLASFITTTILILTTQRLWRKMYG